jgi:RNA polymerase sigma-70 factor, ECF subfamily
MHALADVFRGSTVTMERDLPAEFERRLSELTTLAFRVAYSIVRHSQDAEDIAQDAVALAYQNLPSLRDFVALRAWLVRVAWRRALDHQRGIRRRRQRELAADLSIAPTAEQVAESDRFREDLFEAIDTLPVKLRMTILLCGIEGYDTREVAALLQIPEGTVRSRLHKARQRLMEILK